MVTDVQVKRLRQKRIDGKTHVAAAAAAGLIGLLPICQPATWRSGIL
jgi:hypothetical protein